MAYNAPSMLRFLRIRNFALVDQIEVHFQEGFNLISGETGAGKSSIVDALAWLAGCKAPHVRAGSGTRRATISRQIEERPLSVTDGYPRC